MTDHLDPEALEAAARAVSAAEREMHTNESLGRQRHIAERAVSAYLEAQTEALNPDALEAGAKAMYNEEPWRKNPYSTEHNSWVEIQEEDRQVFREEAEVAVSAYLAAAHLDVEGLARVIMHTQLPYGGAGEYVKLDANAAHAVIELLKPHLAALPATQPEVTSVESIPAKMRLLMWEGGEFEVGEIPDGFVLVGFEMETDRAWSMADKVTINIERREVNDA